MFTNTSEQRVDTVSFSSVAFADKLSGTPAGDFWAAEVAWQREECSKSFKVEISDPQTRSSGFMSSYTDYLILSTICPEGVRRRYSDFDWIRSLLSDRYSGVAIPLMPEKRVLGNQGQAFIEERMAGLNEFMLLLLSNPYVRNDASVRMFFTLKGVSEFDQAKKAANAGQGADPSANPGLARWFGVLRALPLPVDSDQACSELIAATDEAEARVVSTLGGVTRYFEASRAYSDALKAITDAMGDWANVASTSAAGMSDTMAVLKSNTGALGDKLRVVTATFKEAHDLAVFSPNEVQIFLMDGLITELHRLKSLRDLMRRREEAQAEYGRAWKAKETLDFQQKQNKEKGRVDLASQLEPKIAKAQSDLRSRKEKLDDISKGALYIESDKCSRSRLARFVAMTGQYSALCIASGHKCAEVWTKFVAAMGLNQNTLITDAQATLTGVSSMHGMDAVAGSNLSLPAPQSVLEGGSFNPGSGGGGGGGSSGGSGAMAGGGFSPPPPPPPPAAPPAAAFQPPPPSSPPPAPAALFTSAPTPEAPAAPPPSVASMFTSSSDGDASAPPAFFGGSSTVDL